MFKFTAWCNYEALKITEIILENNRVPYIVEKLGGDFYYVYARVKALKVLKIKKAFKKEGMMV